MNTMHVDMHLRSPTALHMKILPKEVEEVRDIASPPREDDSRDELEVRYWRVVELTSKYVLETWVTMLHRTALTLGFPSLIDYCEKTRGLQRSTMKQLFTPSERRQLKGDPTVCPYTRFLNIKLLTRAWAGLDKGVMRKMKDIELHMQSAVFDPPVLSCRDTLQQRLCGYFNQCMKVSHEVLLYCHEKLKEALTPLYKERFTLKNELGLLYKRLQMSKEIICTAPITRAILAMEMNYDLNSRACEENNRLHIERTRIFHLEEEINDHLIKATAVQMKIRLMERLYVGLCTTLQCKDLIEEINNIYNKDVDSEQFCDWRTQLDHLRQDRIGRLETLGRSEILSYSASLRAPVQDTIRWLLTQNEGALSVTKIYSFIKNVNTGKVTTLGQFLSESTAPVTILYGPFGSGKSCVCEYLFNQWCNSQTSLSYLKKLHIFLILKAEDVQGNSFSHHLQHKVFQRCLRDVSSDEVLETLNKVRVGYVVDWSAAASSPAFPQALGELIVNLGDNSLLITMQREKKEQVMQVLKNLKISYEEAYLQPLENPELKTLCMKFNSMSKQRSSNVSNESNRFLQQIPAYQFPVNPRSEYQRYERKGEYHDEMDESESVQENVERFIGKLYEKERGEDIFYPLPLAYLFLLWRDNPGRLNKITTISRMFLEVFNFCQQKLSITQQTLNIPGHCGRKVKETETMNDLYRLGSLVFLGKAVVEPDSRGSGGRENLHMCCPSLFPLLLCGRQGGQHRIHPRCLAHPSLAEVLHARAIIPPATVRLYSLFRNELVNALSVTTVHNTGCKYVNVIKYLCGFHIALRPSLKACAATHLVSLFQSAGVGARDHVLWAALLEEGVYNAEMARAMNITYPNVWKAPQGSTPETKAVAMLVCAGAYKPQEVILTQAAPQEVMRMLTSRPLIDVRLIPPPGFTAVNRKLRQDDVVKGLEPAGSLVEAWASLGNYGAAALGAMTRLHTLYLHLDSLSAFHAFCTGVEYCVDLRYLYLHLELPPSTPVKKLPRLPCRAGVVIILVLSGVQDETCSWVEKVCKRLGCRYRKVVLTASTVSSPAFHTLSSRLEPTPIYLR